MNWYLFRTATRQEDLACEGLKELGVEHYMPRETLVRKLSRREVIDSRPLFPGYLFVNVSDAQFHAAVSADGVHAPLRITTVDGDRVPFRISGALVAAIRTAELNGDFDRTRLPPVTPIEIGERVRITEGSFEGRWGQVVKLKPGDRIKLVLDGYGKTTVSASLVERAA